MNIVQVFFAILLIGPVLWGLINWNWYKGVSAPKGIVAFTSLINSAVLYALAYNLVFFLQELFLVLGKKALGLEAYLYHNNHTWEGEHPLMSLMQGSGALAIFLIGLICLIIYRFIANSPSNWKLLILWLAFHGLVQSLPQVTVAYLAPETDLGEALVGYLNLSQPLLIALAIMCILTIPMINIWFSRLLLEFASRDDDLNNPRARFKYIQFIAVGAAFLGSILVIPFRVPPISQAITPLFVFVVSIPWIWSSANVAKHIKHTPNRINEKIYWTPIVLLILLLIFFQLVLAPGVKF
ncbi:hypothetical protein [Carboxylicivirga marina]|uniref:Uncharacterized protein n=1 Tax=Carboxylicivirga marina TaxID=2800988 RepID=A0ABS1HQV2_9BACT|nr:hypothetical protein [Carboxylicivirga marina]MBK3520059.1 hypothetical protein [Carboxylicivirga marina]